MFPVTGHASPGGPLGLGGLISLICHGSSIYGHAFGGSVVRNFYQGKKDADMVYIDFSLIF